MAGRQPRIHLDRQEHAIGEIIALDGIGQRVHVHRPGWRRTGLGPERRITIPAQRHEDVIADAAGDRHRSVLQRRRRAGAAHVDGGRIAQHVDAEVGGHFLRCRVDRRRNHAVDVGRRQPRVSDRAARCLEHHVNRGPFRAFHKVRFADAGNCSLVREAA